MTSCFSAVLQSWLHPHGSLLAGLGSPPHTCEIVAAIPDLIPSSHTVQGITQYLLQKSEEATCSSEAPANILLTPVVLCADWLEQCGTWEGPSPPKLHG